LKQRLLEILVCPFCHRTFNLSQEIVRGEEIEEGTLLSDCGRSYPIVNGIPRILPSASSSASVSKELGTVTSKLEKTRRSFGFQWTKFKRIDEGDKTEFLAKTLWTENFFKGKLVLDAGCGFGRYAYFAAKFGAEVVGIDLSDAIESASLNTAHLPNVHLVQGDLYNLPFATNTFDAIYSIGVLHHTPDPSAAFSSVSATLRQKGEFSIWVYDRADVGREAINSALRSITTRLPHSLLWKISEVAAEHSSDPPLQKLRNYMIIGNSRVGNFDWYSPQYQHHPTEKEVLSWFQTSGFEQLLILTPPARGFGSSFGAKGIKGTLSDARQRIVVRTVSTSFDKLVDSDLEA
jgi:SAM-dependent methyltransferase